MNNIDNIYITNMTEKYAEQISTWSYGDGSFSIYNQDSPPVDEQHLAFIGDDENLLGYFCFGSEAKIPAKENDAYCEDYLDIGLHIRPDLTGKGLGNIFLSASLNYLRKNLGASLFRATIASFNSRAIALCLGAGFCIEKEITHTLTGNKFTIIKKRD